MNERELADEFDRSRGDISLWSTTPSQADVRTGTVVFSVRFSREELKLLRERAQQEEISVSQLVRRGAMREAREGGPASPVYMHTGPNAEIYYVGRVQQSVPNSIPSIIEIAATDDGDAKPPTSNPSVEPGVTQPA